MFDHDLLAYLEGYLSKERKARFEAVLKNRTNFLTVALEDVYQLHNTSAVVRSCDAFGIQTVHVVEERYEKRLDKNISVGAQKWVDLKHYKSVSDCIASLKQSGYKIVATTPHDTSKTLGDFKVDRKTAVFFGTEWKGLSKEVLAAADGFLHVPMVGFSESLNVSVCTAIILERLTNQLRAGQLPWQLTKGEQLEKRLDWAKKSIKDAAGIKERYNRNK